MQTGLRQTSIHLLVYLALHPDGVTRDQAAAVLWPDLPPDKIGNQFHTACTAVRRVIREVIGLDEPMFILRGSHHYRLDPHYIDVDTWRLSALHQRADRAHSDAERIGALQAFADLYTDDFATDLSDEWIQAHREYLRRTALDALTRLADLYTADDQPEQALNALEQAFRHDIYSEQLCRSIMQLQLRLNRPDAARRTYQLLSSRLLDIDTDPSDQTRQLLIDINSGHHDRQRLLRHRGQADTSRPRNPAPRSAP
ncbi:BTAD domain-containing putative transcriptional regulator, partial [Actinomadura adrarensis]